MHCRHCGTENPEDAVFCKECGAGLRPGGRGPVEEVGAMAPPLAWWFWLGILAILTPFFFLLDFLLGANNAIFVLGTLAAFFLVGSWYFLLVASRESYRKPIVVIVGGALVMSAIGVLPFVVLPLTRSWSLVDIQETYSLPFDEDVSVLDLEVHNRVGRVNIKTVSSPDALVFVWVTVRGWGDPEGAIGGIDWSGTVVEGAAKAKLVLPKRTVGLVGSLSYAVDVHVSTSAILILSLSSTFGSITADLGPGAVGAVELATTSGSVNLNLDRTFLLSVSQFALNTNTGNIGIHIKHASGPPARIPLVAQATAGNVDVALELDPEMGAEGIATTTAGIVYVDPNKFEGTPDSFETLEMEDAITIIVMSLTTTTGNINVS